MVTLDQALGVLRGLYLTFVLSLTFQTLSRSLDYLTGNPQGSESSVVGLEPPIVWGFFGLVVFAVLIIGLTFRQPMIISGGACAAIVLNLTLAWMHFVSIIDLGLPYDDWRSATAHLSGAVMWAAIAVVGVLIPSFEKVKKERNGISAGTDL